MKVKMEVDFFSTEEMSETVSKLSEPGRELAALKVAYDERWDQLTALKEKVLTLEHQARTAAARTALTPIHEGLSAVVGGGEIMRRLLKGLAPKVTEYNNNPNYVDKIGAIKVIREIAGVGLKEAKDLFEESWGKF